MPRIAGVAAAFPPHSYPQAEITELLGPIITNDASKRLLLNRLHQNSKVASRHLVMPYEWYRDSSLNFTLTNNIFIGAAVDLAEEAVVSALAKASLQATDIDYVIFTSVTGISAPSVDALLALRLGFRSDVKRVPMFGLGCVAGAAGIARANDYLLGHPNDVALLISVELCSLTVQRGDDSMGNLVASGLFGDGAAAVLMVGSDRAETMAVTGPDVLDSRSRLYPGTEAVLGFNPGESGFRIVLTAGVADVIDEHFDDDVVGFLTEHDLAVADIDVWMAHPGGPRVLESFSSALGLPQGALDVSWQSMAAKGNMSSASILHVLAETLSLERFDEGGLGLLFALGPGVCAEIVLLKWPESQAQEQQTSD
ncbi:MULTISPECIES: type III polyketide synthase [Subtercola]|uniref:Type III polyketide synthase n=1 Tax=Subtercola vilae TaxID=2056433 RepID=A0A4T2C1W3_9MICO|nr:MULTISPECIES: 3-oxoacyl-[acyl-carrier-protein] synthase III C-terminal domain-containing protein [Subtercola]MEA9986529.1 3-oxoacyl-[acyl-carrier-protein] synthase III C-terminal domain-containing protein [Subtercola sp. RTI3]TIH38293.1 type III polyketide synthase [Subtercola vilae]